MAGARRTKHVESQHSYEQDCDNLQAAGRTVCCVGNNDSLGLLWLQVCVQCTLHPWFFFFFCLLKFSWDSCTDKFTVVCWCLWVQGIPVTSLGLPELSVPTPGEQNRCLGQPQGSLQQASLQGQLQGSWQRDPAGLWTAALAAEAGGGTDCFNKSSCIWKQTFRFCLQYFSEFVLVFLFSSVRLNNNNNNMSKDRYDLGKG